MIGKSLKNIQKDKCGYRYILLYYVIYMHILKLNGY